MRRIRLTKNSEVPLPGPDEIAYLGYTDPESGNLIIKMTLHSGASLTISSPDSDAGRSDMMRLVGNFHAYMADMADNFYEFQEKWFDNQFKEIADEIGEEFDL